MTTLADPTVTAGSVEADAHEFGSQIKHGGWHRAQLVARSVLPGEGVGRPPKEIGAPDPDLVGQVKVSARTFASYAGTTHKRVIRHYDAWAKAADAGLVPHPMEMVPGETVVLPDAKLWSQYYSTKRGEPPVQMQFARTLDKLDDLWIEMLSAVADSELNRAELSLDDWLGQLRRVVDRMVDIQR